MPIGSRPLSPPEAQFYKKDDFGIICRLCPHGCRIKEGQKGICQARKNVKGKLYADSYGMISSIALDPIEKKPLYHFEKGKWILSVGGLGCNFHCQFCQNHEISMPSVETTRQTSFVPPHRLVSEAQRLTDRGNVGIAYTYNEPSISYEYVYDTSRLAKEKGLKTVMVTNGYINIPPLLKIIPFIDAVNIDLKSFQNKFYVKIGGTIEPVKEAIALCAKHIHVEITTLVIPGQNDSEEEISALSQFIKKIDPEIPLHLSRFFPRCQWIDMEPTPVGKIHALVETAKKNLKYVYPGNI